MPDRSSIGVRVRPDASNFIRDLEAQLRTRRYTFKVDVGARTSQATTDVREWANSTLKRIRAQVNVGADMTRANQEIRAWRAAQSRNGIKIPVSLDFSNQQSFDRAIRDYERSFNQAANRAGSGRRAGGARRPTDAIKLPVQLDVDQSRLERDLKLPGAGQMEIPLGIDTSKARVQIEQLKGEQLELDLGIDTGKARAENAAFRAAAKDPVRTKLDLDTKQARLELLQLRLAERYNKINVKVDVERSALRRTLDQLQDFQKKAGHLTVLRSLDLGPISLGKPTGLVGTLTTLTAISGLVPATATGLAAAADAMVRLGGAAAILPGALAAVGTSLGVLKLGTVGVGTAFKTMYQLWNEGSDQQQRQARTVVAAQDALSNAVYDEAKAQDQVGKARRGALNELRDLHNELRGSVLNEAQAILDAQKARDTYAQGLSKGFSTQTEQQQSLLDIAKADQNVIDVRERNIQLQQRVNDSNKEGVEGSDKVKDAVEAQRRSVQALTAATQALQDAQQQGATSKFNDALAQLSPNARDAVESVHGLKEAVTGFQQSIEDDIFRGVGPAIRSGFANMLPVIGPGIHEIAQGLNQNILQVFNSLQTGDGKSIIQRILGGTAEAQKAVTGVIDPLVRGVGTLVAAGSEHLPQVVDLIRNLADRFAFFIQTADKTGNLDKWMDEGVSALKNLAETGINVIKIINDFHEAFKTAFGRDIFQVIADVTAKWAQFFESKEGQDKLLRFIAQARDLWKQWQPILHDLPDILSRVSETATRALDNVILPALNTITSVLHAIPGSVEVFAGIWVGASMFRAVGAVVNFGKLLGGLLEQMTRLGAMALPNLNNITNPFPGTVPPPGGSAATAAERDAAAAGRTRLGGFFGALGTAAPIIGLGIAAGTAAAGVEAAVDQNSLPQGGNPQLAQQSPTRQLREEDVRNRKVPPGFPAPGSVQAEQAMSAAAAQGDRAAQWVVSTQNKWDQAARYAWLVNHPDQDNKPDFQPPPDYMAGGFTNWPRTQGVLAELHGKEYVQPADTVAHYGVDAMQAVHEKRAAILPYDEGGPVPPPLPPNLPFPTPWTNGGRSFKGDTMFAPMDQGGNRDVILPEMGAIPRGFPMPGVGPQGDPVFGPMKANTWGKYTEFLPGASYSAMRGGLIRSFDDGGYNDPNDPRDPRNRQPGGPGILDLVAGAAAGIGGKVAGALPGGPALSPAAPGGPDPLATPTGPVGGPVPAGPSTGLDPTGGVLPKTDPSQLQKVNVLGFGIPIPGTEPVATPGWGQGGPPVGLGGLDANGQANDIRNMGIGPGPPGSGPGDWANYTTGFFTKTLSSAFQAILGQGVLGFFGAEGATSTPLANAAQGLFGHFASAPGLWGGMNNAPGNAGTTDAVNQGLATWAGMGTNPAYPGYAQMPSVYGQAGSYLGSPGKASEAGLQPNAIRANRAISAAFPMIQRIGGVRSDSLHWHPDGLALDVMIPGERGNNDPTTPAGLALGNQIWAWLGQHASELGVDMNASLWQKPDHYNHIHVAVYGKNNPGPEGTLPLDGSGGGLAPAAAAAIAAAGGGGGGGSTPGPFGSAVDAMKNIVAQSMQPALPGNLRYATMDEWFQGVRSGPGAANVYGNLGAPPGMQFGSYAQFFGLPGYTRGSASGGFNAPGPAGGDAQIKQLAYALYLRSGLPPGEWNDFEQLIQHESSWNPTAQNPGSTAFGLGQFLDSTWQSVGGQKTSDPAAQLQMIFSYLKSRPDYHGSPAAAWALWQSRSPHWYDQGGWLMPGETHAVNATGKPELILPPEHSAAYVSSFAEGGYNWFRPESMPTPPSPQPDYNVPNATQMQPQPQPGVQQAPAQHLQPTPVQTPPTGAPPPTANAPVTPPLPAEPHGGTGAPPGPQGTDRAAPSPIQVIPSGPNNDSTMHVHPALKKGIMSAFNTAGGLAGMAVSMGMMGAGGGGAGSLVAGLFNQAGKIAVDIANIPSSFLVGNITGGTTDNPYGQTQRGPHPPTGFSGGRGGATVVDSSSNHFGDIYTQNLDEYFRRIDLREAQRTQGALGRFG